MPIPIEYQWMKPETACFINGEDDFIMSGPWKIDHYTWWVDLKYHGPTLCNLVKPNNNPEVKRNEECMNKTKIDWPWKPLYTWNPIVGCRKGCEYCYAKEVNNRFKIIPKWEEPRFMSGRFKDPIKRKISANIFVGSMADLFGEWVRDCWIQAIINITKQCPQHTFMFLTKNPQRYEEFIFPKNCWLGTTITCDPDDYEAEFKRDYHMLQQDKNETFLSLEPIYGPNNYYFHLGHYDTIIVGADSRKGATPPKREWVDSIKHRNIYYKNNIIKHFPDLENKEE